MPLGLTASRGAIRAEPAGLIQALKRWFDARGSMTWGGAQALPIPVCVGNYTDMLMTPERVQHLTTYLALHTRAFPTTPVCVVTKARLSREAVEALDSVNHRIVVFLSQSFMSDSGWQLERGPVADSKATIANAHLLGRSRNLIGVHFWRPVADRTVPDLATAVAGLTMLLDAGTVASVVIGLKCGPGVPVGPFDVRDFAGERRPGPDGQVVFTEGGATDYGSRAAAWLSSVPTYLLRHRESARTAGSTGDLAATHTRAALCAVLMPGLSGTRCDGRRSTAEPPSSDLLTRAAPSVGVSPSRVEMGRRSSMRDRGRGPRSRDANETGPPDGLPRRRRSGGSDARVARRAAGTRRGTLRIRTLGTLVQFRRVNSEPG